MEGLFGRIVKREPLNKKMIQLGIRVNRVLITERKKKIILFDDGSMISTYEENIIGIDTEIILIPEDELIEEIVKLEEYKCSDEYLIEKYIKKQKEAYNTLNQQLTNNK